MRARGAKATDIAVIVVAADDGAKPQTDEAIDHAKAAEVPIVVAVNKIDKEGADPVRVRTELAQRGLNPAEWGGDTEFVDVSAKTQQGLDDLLEVIGVVADIAELKANPDAEASGVVIESRLDPGRGPVVTLLVQRGTLHVGDALVAGSTWGRVRAMHDYRGERVTDAKPGDPVEVLGLRRRPRGGRLRPRRGERPHARGRPPRSARCACARSSRRAARAASAPWRTSSRRSAPASSRSSTSSSRATSPAPSRRSRTRSRSSRRTRWRSTSSTPASAASPSPTSCSRRRPRRSSSASTCGPSGRRASWPIARASRSATTPSSTG